MDVYRTPDERFAGLPGYAWEPHYADVDGLRIHYLDEGAGDPVLLLHGEPTWSFLYRKLIPALGGVARVVAPDYAGFGRSDKPTERGWYTHDRHYEVLERFVEQLDLRRVTAVAARLGRAARLPARRRAPGADRAPGHPQHGDLLRASAGRGLAAVPRVRPPHGHRLPAGAADPHHVPDRARGRRRGRATTRRSRRRSRRPACSCSPSSCRTEPDHPSAAKMLEVREGLRTWPGRALVLFGDSDPVFAPRVGERFAELIPGAEPAETRRGRRPLPPGGPRRGGRRADRRGSVGRRHD